MFWKVDLALQAILHLDFGDFGVDVKTSTRLDDLLRSPLASNLNVLSVAQKCPAKTVIDSLCSQSYSRNSGSIHKRSLLDNVTYKCHG
jgi:hypothetical protein